MARLTQQDVAQRVGLSRTSITNIERGRQHIPLHFLYLLASAVGVPPEQLLPGKDFAHAETNSTVLPPKIIQELDKHDVDETTRLWFERMVSRIETRNQGASSEPQKASRKGSKRP